MTGVWCVRADGGRYTEAFVRGGYVAIGWREVAESLAEVRSRGDLEPILKAAYPEIQSAVVLGNNVGQVARFLLDIQPGDYIVTPAADSEWLQYGQVLAERYDFAPGDDGCPFRHRRPVRWEPRPVRRGDFSVPFQNTSRSLLTVFAISQADEFLTAIGRRDLTSPSPAVPFDPHEAVLEKVLGLDSREFEILVGHLLTALGFEGSEVTGRPGDGGVDAVGELNVSNLAKVKIFVQAKRYKVGSKISAATVRSLRQAIPRDGQGAFITTADFQRAAAQVALDPNFPRIGLINGRQLVDLLVEHWDDLPAEFQELLGLKKGLVPR